MSTSGRDFDDVMPIVVAGGDACLLIRRDSFQVDARPHGRASQEMLLLCGLSITFKVVSLS